MALGAVSTPEFEMFRLLPDLDRTRGEEPFRRIWVGYIRTRLSTVRGCRFLWVVGFPVLAPGPSSRTSRNGIFNSWV